jgi:hypothetical protein
MCAESADRDRQKPGDASDHGPPPRRGEFRGTLT